MPQYGSPIQKRILQRYIRSNTESGLQNMGEPAQCEESADFAKGQAFLALLI